MCEEICSNITRRPLGTNIFLYVMFEHCFRPFSLELLSSVCHWFGFELNMLIFLVSLVVVNVVK